MNRKKQAALYLASAGIPCFLFLTALIIVDAIPFGSNSILISDACGQYLDFLSYWKTILSGENDLFYTFSKNMGGDTLNLAAYYLLSPFNLLVLFSNAQTLPLFYTAIVTLKIAFCGLTFFHLSCKLYSTKASHLLFSSAYALMAYNILYGWNIMWLDGVLILPLLVLGLHRMMDGGRPWLYCICLFYALATNFYIGYMLCITAVLQFAGELFARSCPVRSIPRHFGRFCAASLIGGLSAAAVWVPTFASLAGERAQTTTTEFILSRNFSVYGFLPKLLSGAASTTEMAGGTPHVFCSTVVLLLVFVFLLNRSISLRTRIAAGGILFLIFISFYLQPLNIVWHGFSSNNSFNYRYSFIFSFFLVAAAQYVFEKGKTVPRKEVLLSGGLLLAAFLAAMLQRRGFSSGIGNAASLMALAVSVICLCIHPKSRLSVCLICAVTLMELGVNSAVSWNALVTYHEMVEHESYQSFVQQTGPAIAYVKEQDSGFYRMEKNFHRTINDPAFFSYNGLSHFSSTEPAFTKQFMRKMGFSTEKDFWAWYGEGSTAETDSLLGVKYLLSREPLAGEKDYTLLTELGGVHVYRNESALPIAILCSMEIADESIEQEDPFSLHNRIWQQLSGGSEDILIPSSCTVSTENLICTQTSDEGYLYEKEDPALDAAVRYEIAVSENLPLYVFFAASEFQEADLYINGVCDGAYFDMNRWNMVNTGTHTPGETLTVELRLQDDTLSVDNAFFYYEDPAVLAQMAASIQAKTPSLTQRSSSRLEGSFTADTDQLLLFTIPYNDGWKLQIDGEEAPCQRVMNTFLSAQIPAGTHSFHLQYIPKGLYLGCGLSLTALFLAGIWYCLQKKSSLS